jgi:hypothetical protein
MVNQRHLLPFLFHQMRGDFPVAGVTSGRYPGFSVQGISVLQPHREADIADLMEPIPVR